MIAGEASREELVERLAAIDAATAESADRELSRKAAAGGLFDAAWRHRWMRGARPIYADYHAAAKRTQRLHVAVDAMEISFGVSGGVETYMIMLVKCLLGAGYGVTVACLPHQLQTLRWLFGDRAGYMVARGSFAVRAAIAASRRLGRPAQLVPATSLATFSRLREDFGVDVLHSPVQVFSLLDFRAPAVLNLHDLQHLHFPENFRPSDIEARERFYRLSAGLAGAIVVSSDFVRHDVVDRMGVSPGKVFTVPVTWNPALEEGLRDFGPEDARRKYGLPDEFALYPAQFWPHKNHATLVEALARVKAQRPKAKFKLVFTGFRGFAGWQPTQARIRELGLVEDIVCLDHVPYGHLAGLYRASRFCVMPSTFEASSYPVIEAQVLGVPAMCSDVTSLPELMKDGAGLLFPPRDADAIAAAMVRWIDDPADRQAHAERGRARARRENSPDAYVAGVAAAYEHAIRSR